MNNIKELNRRNTETVEKVLKDINEMVYKQQTLIQKQSEAINSLTIRIGQLENKYNIFKVQTTGFGPTSR